MKIMNSIFLVALILLTNAQYRQYNIDDKSYQFLEQCVKKDDLGDLEFEGNIFYERFMENDIGLWHINKSLSLKTVDTEGFSIDGKFTPQANLLLYVKPTKPRQIFLIDATGQVVLKIPWQNNWDYPIRLTLKDEIVVNHLTSYQNTDTGFSILAFDTGKIVERIYDKFPFTGPYYANKPSGFVVSPTGEQVVYQAELINSNDKIDIGLILTSSYPYTTVSNKVIWKSFDEKQVGGVRWSPDGHLFAYTPNASPEVNGWWFPHPSEIAIVNENGDEIARTHFNSDADYYTPYNLSWSTNGHMLAFWLGKLQNWDQGKAQFVNQTLVVWDITKHTMYNLCLDNKIGSLAEIIWSPDNTHFTYKGIEDDAIIVDIRQNSYFALRTGVNKIIGWLN